MLSERTSIETSHREELEKAKGVASEEAKASESEKRKTDLLSLTRVLRVAAAKRQSGDEDSAESRALEGILLLVYGGEDEAVEVMEKLFAKSEELVPTIEGTPSQYTCKSFKHFPLAVETSALNELVLRCRRPGSQARQ